MEITLTRKDDVNALLSVALTEADYTESYKKRLKDVMAKGQFKGFRPGKVPASFVEKMYGTSLRVDAVNDVLGNAVDAYIRDNALAVLGQPLPAQGDEQPTIDWKNSRDYTFVFELGLAPDFKAPVLAEMELTTYTIDVSDENVAQTIENLRERFGNTVVPDASAPGDEIYGSLAKEDGSWSIEKTMVPTNKLAAAAIADFSGKKIGDKVTFDLKAAFDTHQIQHLTGLSKDEAAAVSGNYVLTIENVNRKELAEVNEEFYKKVFPYEGEGMTEEVFNTLLREEVAKAYAQDANHYRNEAIRKAVAGAVSMELPQDFLERWLLSTNEKLSAADLKGQMSYFLDDLRWTLVRDKMMKEQLGIEADYNTILDFHKSRSKAMLMQYGLPDDEKLDETATRFAMQQLSENKGENYNRMSQEALNEVFYANAANAVKLTTLSVSVVEFEEKLHHLLHH